MTKTNYELTAEMRSERGTAAMRRARKTGNIPAVLYSRNAESKLLFVSSGEWEALSKHEFNLLTLRIGKKKTAAMVKEVQANYLKSYIVHIDFQEVKMDEKITASIPVHAGLKEPVGIGKGGILEQVIHEIELTCLPGDLPEHLEADISALEVGESLHVGEITLPANVALAADPHLVVFHVAKPVSEEEAAPAAEEAEGGEEPEETAEESE
ncbi:MAG: 50S ribosomal protein L25 [Victivallales bacterium]|nr:50S ribosomal protein L25 [Victivallales bacterium]